MQADSDIERLRIRRRRLIVVYVAFVFLFGSSCAMAASGVAQRTVLSGFAASALVALPLYVFVVLVHSATRAIKPNAGTSGLKQLVASIVLLTPIEAALVLPAINLYISRRDLIAHVDNSRTRPDHLPKPNPLRESAEIARRVSQTSPE